MMLHEIELWYFTAEYFSKYYSIKKEITVTERDIFDALYIAFADDEEFDWRGDLWGMEVDLIKIKNALDDFDFKILKQRIETSQEILPQELRIEIKALVKNNNLIWVIHKNDVDPFPSNPHAHLQNSRNLKMDLSTGAIYQKRKLVHSIGKKELLNIREKASKVFNGELPELNLT